MLSPQQLLGTFWWPPAEVHKMEHFYFSSVSLCSCPSYQTGVKNPSLTFVHCCNHSSQSTQQNLFGDTRAFSFSLWTHFFFTVKYYFLLVLVLTAAIHRFQPLCIIPPPPFPDFLDRGHHGTEFENLDLQETSTWMALIRDRVPVLVVSGCGFP